MNQDSFIKALADLNIFITEDQLKQLYKYYELLVEKNKVMNLTGITEVDQVYLKHFYDSLTLNKIIDLKNVNSLCDVGTGAGFPGLVIKILFPHINVTLVDSLNKRINFLNEVINELKLEGIEAIHARAEEFAIKNREKYDVVTARAVTTLNVLSEFCLPLVKKNKYFIPMKANINNEIEESNRALKVLGGKIEKIIEFKLPVENSNRTLVLIKKEVKTNNKYPRKFSEIKKRPL